MRADDGGGLGDDARYLPVGLGFVSFKEQFSEFLGKFFGVLFVNRGLLFVSWFWGRGKGYSVVWALVGISSDSVNGILDGSARNLSHSGMERHRSSTSYEFCKLIVEHLMRANIREPADGSSWSCSGRS